MRGLVLVLLVLVVLSLFSFMASSENYSHKETNQNFEFKTFTSAVCEEKADAVYCKDEIFVNCNGNISKADRLAECNGIILDVPKATGAATFGKGWKDPRI